MSLTFIPPQLPTLMEKPPEGSEWIHEIKYDGYRTQLIIENGSVLLSVFKIVKTAALAPKVASNQSLSSVM
jgi:hypothetical protein